MSNMQGGWLLGLLVLSVLFLRKGKAKTKNLQALPINQDWNQSPYSGLLPYIHAQAFHESGGFKSRLAVEQKNLFGMKVPRVRKFAGFKVEGSEFAGYRNFRESVEDFMLWLESVSFPKTVSGSAQYVAELKKRNYFEDTISNYLKGVNSALKNEIPFSNHKITYF